jgi:hypothetical protein
VNHGSRKYRVIEEVSYRTETYLSVSQAVEQTGEGTRLERGHTDAYTMTICGGKGEPTIAYELKSSDRHNDESFQRSEGSTLSVTAR